ncbi:symmetrical bis(5'-nucleosyl)-tetraphosphatase [Shewanella sp. SR44-3]|uniref:symmetrical bis(5'-nucleosyl)-tetraphosphatase n=1 Tax=unclassified Shewanella TaxID=196818 RepID=UPI0015FB6221|nr:symmetrical bis(5'-nucleosyl)-tetraphosphatase [Shewanella sp. SR44-3]MBB1268674.1 symmetrical bis(5'-nucleosyl)-tetraphosphatase [Shewanella sp. SR44-3]
MAHYFVGDIQGCFAELELLLQKVGFNPSIDELWAVGDMVARGPDSLKTLRYLKSLESSAKLVLGNHDLHLLAVQGKLKSANPKDNLGELLAATDLNILISWLRELPLVQFLPEYNIVMTHAGVPPQWDLTRLTIEAEQVSQALKRSDYLESLIAHMYINGPAQWSETLSDIDRLRYCINGLTRMRYLHRDGSLEFDCKLPPQDNLNTNITPWFTFKSATSNQTKVFGHWAALMGQTGVNDIKALDTGCCWGEHLTLWQVENNEKITQTKLNSR